MQNESFKPTEFRLWWLQQIINQFNYSQLSLSLSPSIYLSSQWVGSGATRAEVRELSELWERQLMPKYSGKLFSYFQRAVRGSLVSGNSMPLSWAESVNLQFLLPPIVKSFLRVLATIFFLHSPPLSFLNIWWITLYIFGLSYFAIQMTA